MYIMQAEITTDIALGVAAITATFVMFVICLLFFPLFNGLGHANFFFLLAGICTIGFIFVYFFVGETQGLNEREKKEQYWPGGRYGRKLKAGEACKASQCVWSNATMLLQAQSNVDFNRSSNDSRLLGIGNTVSDKNSVLVLSRSNSMPTFSPGNSPSSS